MRTGEMQSMREVLQASLGRSLQGLSPLDRLLAAWPVACGRAMAEHGVVTAFEEGRATVNVEDAVWLRQMLAMRIQLTSALRGIAGVEVREIHFQLTAPVQCGSVANDAAEPRRFRPHLHPETP